MHTMIRLHAGYLTTTIISRNDVIVDRRRWADAIAPALAHLRAYGDGRMLVFHDDDPDITLPDR